MRGFVHGSHVSYYGAVGYAMALKSADMINIRTTPPRGSRTSREVRRTHVGLESAEFYWRSATISSRGTITGSNRSCGITILKSSVTNASEHMGIRETSCGSIMHAAVSCTVRTKACRQFVRLNNAQTSENLGGHHNRTQSVTSIWGAGLIGARRHVLQDYI